MIGERFCAELCRKRRVFGTDFAPGWLADFQLVGRGDGDGLDGFV